MVFVSSVRGGGGASKETFTHPRESPSSCGLGLKNSFPLDVQRVQDAEMVKLII